MIPRNAIWRIFDSSLQTSTSPLSTFGKISQIQCQANIKQFLVWFMCVCEMFGCSFCLSFWGQTSEKRVHGNIVMYLTLSFSLRWCTSALSSHMWCFSVSWCEVCCWRERWTALLTCSPQKWENKNNMMYVVCCTLKLAGPDHSFTDC